MTTPDTTEQDPPQDPTAEQRKQRAAVGCLALIGATAAVSIGIAIPETAYYAAGLMTLAAYREGRKWFTGRRDSDDEADVVDIVAALHELSPNRAQNVRHTQLKELCNLADTKEVKRLLKEVGVPTRPGVRAAGMNGPGVHATDIPPDCDPPLDDCWCRSQRQQTANNTPEEGPEEGFRVETTGEAGVTVYDLSQTVTRHRAIKK